MVCCVLIEPGAPLGCRQPRAGECSTTHCCHTATQHRKQTNFNTHSLPAVKLKLNARMVLVQARATTLWLVMEGTMEQKFDQANDDLGILSAIQSCMVIL